MRVQKGGERMGFRPPNHKRILQQRYAFAQDRARRADPSPSQKKLTRGEQKARIRAQQAEFLTGVRPTFPPPKNKPRKHRALVAPKKKRPADQPPDWEVRLRLDKEVRERAQQPPPPARPGLVKRKDLA